MMKKIVFLCSFFFFFAFSAAKSEASISIQSIPPESLFNKNVTYFDLKLQPAQEENLTVIITNSGNSPVRLKVSVNNAITNDNGVVEHSSEAKKHDASLKYFLADLVKYKKNIEVPANESVNYEFTIKAPSENFSGLISGGISFLEDQPSEGEESGITNVKAYVKGITLHGEPDIVKSDMKLTKVFANLDNSYIALFGNLKNPTASFINSIDSTVKVYRKEDFKGKKSLYENHKSDLQMAPNSNFNYNFRIGDGKRIQPGEYVWVQDVKSPQGTWHFEKNFEITGAQASELNQKDVKIQAPNIWLYVAIGVGSLLLLLLIIWIIRRHLRNKRELKELREKAAKNEE